MKEIIKSKITFLCSFIALLIGFVWFWKTDDFFEPLLIISVAFIEILAYWLLSSKNDQTNPISPLTVSPQLTQNVNVNVNVNEESILKKNEVIPTNEKSLNRNEILQLMKSKTKILFIDDDKNFDIVKVLKNSGWKYTKSVIDVKAIDIETISTADIIFVDINGVGKIMNLENEGLDLAYMIKQQYPEKFIIIYSANRNSNSFHNAWGICDHRLEKNALPIQFTSLVEERSYNLYQMSN